MLSALSAFVCSGVPTTVISVRPVDGYPPPWVSSGTGGALVIVVLFFMTHEPVPAWRSDLLVAGLALPAAAYLAKGIWPTI